MHPGGASGKEPAANAGEPHAKEMPYPLQGTLLGTGSWQPGSGGSLEKLG